MSYHEEDTQKAGVGMLQDLGEALEDVRRGIAFSADGTAGAGKVIAIVAPAAIGALCLIANSLSQIADELRATRRGGD